MLQMLKSETGSKESYDEYLRYLNYAEEKLKINCYSYYEDLLNHCIRMVNYGRSDFEERIIEFGKLMEDKNMFEKYGISSNDIKIIMECSIGMKKYEWAEEFVKRNIKNVKDLNRENIYNLGLGKICFFKKEYSNSRDHLIKVSFEDYLQYVDAKLIEARIEYEERSFMEIFSVIETVSKYLTAHMEIGEIYKQSYLAFINFLPRLVKIYEMAVKEGPYEFDLKKLKEDITAFPNLLYGAEWLQEKLNEIEKGRL
jgi:hypothetical protein